MNDDARTVQCPFCGNNHFEARREDYLYSHEGDYLLVPNTPVQVCLECGMVYYDGAVLEAIERRFFAIRQNVEKLDHY